MTFNNSGLSDVRRVLINSVFAKKGGALTYIQNVVSELQKSLGDNVELIVLRTKTEDAAKYEVPGVRYINNDEVSVQNAQAVSNPLKRIWHDQVTLPKMIKKEKIDVLFSAGNFGVLRCPCKQILLVRNTVFFDDLYLQRIQSWKIKLFYKFQRLLTVMSMRAADYVLFPSQSMYNLVAAQIESKSKWKVAHYGSRPDLFYGKTNDKKEGDPIRLFHVGLYSDQKNLSTLFRGLQILDSRYKLKFKLELTAGFNQNWLGESAFFPNFKKEQEMYFDLQSKGLAEDIDWLNYSALAERYRLCDIFLFPSYTESFGHPLVEAMHSGLAIVASDTEINRELCGDAALYFSTFDAEDCALKIEQLSIDVQLKNNLIEKGRKRAAQFTWGKHAKVLRDCVYDLCEIKK